MKREFSDKAKEDLKLVELARDKGDQEAYSRLMAKYKVSVLFMVKKIVNNRDEAEDLVIEVFAKAFINIAKYRPDFAFSTWLFRIATNHSIDYVRKKRIKTQSLDASIGNNQEDDNLRIQVTDGALNPYELTIKKQKIELVRMIVTNLPEKYQKLVILRYFREYSYDEIAEELDMPIGTVKAQLFRSRDLLQKMVEGWKGKM